jgi:hypothetical protein
LIVIFCTNIKGFIKKSKLLGGKIDGGRLLHTLHSYQIIPFEQSMDKLGKAAKISIKTLGKAAKNVYFCLGKVAIMPFAKS